MAELRHYAELLDGRVRLKAWYDPERLPPGGELVDITDIKPEPETWALYAPAADEKTASSFVSIVEAPMREAPKEKAIALAKSIDWTKETTNTGKALRALLMVLLDIDL